MAAFIHRLETEGVLLPANGKATDADLLDGRNSTFYKLRCTNGRFLYLGMCFERDPRDVFDSQNDAIRDCADEGMRLPSHGELRALRELVLTGTEELTMAEAEWTDDLADTTDSFLYAWVGTNGSGTFAGSSNSEYRCVSGPVG